MGAKMKGIYKSFKYISQIFVVKEREMEIGYPADVKHVAHIGWDGDSANAPSWIKEFKTASDFSASSLNNGGNRRNPSRWSSQGAGIDLSSLSIVEGKTCWDLYIDGLVISSNGNLLDALGAAIKVERHYIIDATTEEESHMCQIVSCWD